MRRGGKIGPVRYVGVLVGYADNSPSYRVWRLWKCLYGRKQSPRMWNQTIDKLLKKLGFTRFASEHGIYVKCKESSLVKDRMGKVINIGSKNYMS